MLIALGLGLAEQANIAVFGPWFARYRIPFPLVPVARPTRPPIERRSGESRANFEDHLRGSVFSIITRLASARFRGWQVRKTVLGSQVAAAPHIRCVCLGEYLEACDGPSRVSPGNDKRRRDGYDSRTSHYGVDAGRPDFMKRCLISHVEHQMSLMDVDTVFNLDHTDQNEREGKRIVTNAKDTWRRRDNLVFVPVSSLIKLDANMPAFESTALREVVTVTKIITDVATPGIIPLDSSLEDLTTANNLHAAIAGDFNTCPSLSSGSDEVDIMLARGCLSKDENIPSASPVMEAVPSTSSILVRVGSPTEDDLLIKPLQLLSLADMPDVVDTSLLCQVDVLVFSKLSKPLKSSLKDTRTKINRVTPYFRESKRTAGDLSQVKESVPALTLIRQSLPQSMCKLASLTDFTTVCDRMLGKLTTDIYKTRTFDPRVKGKDGVHDSKASQERRALLGEQGLKAFHDRMIHHLLALGINGTTLLRGYVSESDDVDYEDSIDTRFAAEVHAPCDPLALIGKGCSIMVNDVPYPVQDCIPLETISTGMTHHQLAVDDTEAHDNSFDDIVGSDNDDSQTSKDFFHGFGTMKYAPKVTSGD